MSSGARGMRMRVLLGEAWRNVLGGASHATVVTSLLAAIMLVAGMTELVSIRALIEEGEQFRGAGAAVQTISATGAIDGVTCEAVNAVGGVAAAGSIRQASAALRPAALPASTVPAYEVSPSLTRTFGVRVPARGILLSTAVAERLGVATGDDLVLQDGVAHVGGVFEWREDGRRAGLGYAALIPVPSAARFDECWAEAWPAAPALTDLLRSVVLPEFVDSANPPKLSALNESWGSTFRGGARFDRRITQLVPWAAGIAGVLVSLIAVRTRRLELATAQHFGVPRASLVAIVLLETALTLVLPIVVSVAMIGAGISFGLGEQDACAVARVGLRVIAASAGAALLGAAIGAISVRGGAYLRYLQGRR